MYAIRASDGAVTADSTHLDEVRIVRAFRGEGVSLYSEVNPTLIDNHSDKEAIDYDQALKQYMGSSKDGGLRSIVEAIFRKDFNTFAPYFQPNSNYAAIEISKGLF